MEYPLVSIIIPVKPGGAVKALECIKWLDYPEERLEIFVSEGTQPSRQRNEAARRAKGEIVYFLDDDSCPVPDALKRIVRHFEDEKVAAVGGPSITPEGDSLLQRTFGAALGSFLGGFSIRNRYKRVGKVRASSENELILCNLAFRKSLFIEEGGLDERLYPNEENELMNRLQKNGYRLIHDPDAYILRSQRKRLSAFVRQMFNYGRGRAEQTMAAPDSLKLSHFIPSLFLVYLVSAIFFSNLLYLLPLGCYAAINIFSSLYAGATEKEWRFALILPAIYFIMHICYGAGVMWGFLKGLTAARREPLSKVTIRLVK